MPEGPATRPCPTCEGAGYPPEADVCPTCRGSCVRPGLNPNPIAQAAEQAATAAGPGSEHIITTPHGHTERAARA